MLAVGMNPGSSGFNMTAEQAQPAWPCEGDFQCCFPHPDIVPATPNPPKPSCPWNSNTSRPPFLLPSHGLEIPTFSPPTATSCLELLMLIHHFQHQNSILLSCPFRIHKESGQGTAYNNNNNPKNPQVN